MASNSELESVTLIRPRKGWGDLGIKEIWAFRELLYFLIWREIKGRYRQMALGPTWIILKPFVTMVVLSLVFGKLAKLPSEGVPYPLFSYSALLPWTLFTVSLNKSATSLVSNMGIISKVYFPRMVVPIATACAGLVDFFMSFLILIGMMLFYGYMPGLKLLVLPMYLALAVATAMSVGLWLATLAVKFRDVAYAVEHLLQVAMYLTPVVYPASMVPEAWRGLYMLNPMAQVVEGFRWALVGAGHAPDLRTLAVWGIVLVLLFSGAHLFRRTERTVVDLM
jgi:lipopolysaccharide transport system permease protein